MRGFFSGSYGIFYGIFRKMGCEEIFLVSCLFIFLGIRRVRFLLEECVFSLYGMFLLVVLGGSWTDISRGEIPCLIGRGRVRTSRTTSLLPTYFPTHPRCHTGRILYLYRLRVTTRVSSYFLRCIP